MNAQSCHSQNGAESTAPARKRDLQPDEHAAEDVGDEQAAAA